MRIIRSQTDDADWSSPFAKVHSSPNAQQKGYNHGIKAPFRVAGIMNQGVNCGSTFADRPTAQSHVVKSGTRGSCKKDRSHGICSLEEVTQPINCNFCAHDFGDSIPHRSIWKALNFCGINHEYIRSLKKIYKDQKASVQTHVENNMFEVKKGT